MIFKKCILWAYIEDIDYWNKKIKIIIRKITLGMGLGSARDEKEIRYRNHFWGLDCVINTLYNIEDAVDGIGSSG